MNLVRLRSCITAKQGREKKNSGSSNVLFQRAWECEIKELQHQTGGEERGCNSWEEKKQNLFFFACGVGRNKSFFSLLCRGFKMGSQLNQMCKHWTEVIVTVLGFICAIFSGCYITNITWGQQKTSPDKRVSKRNWAKGVGLYDPFFLLYFFILQRRNYARHFPDMSGP